MKIAGAHTVPAAREWAFALLQDPVVLARCMPGCQALERTGDGEYHMKMKMVLASMSGLFDGRVKVADSCPPESFRLTVEGAGKIGFMKGEGVLTLAAVDGGTGVAFAGDVHVGGTLAAVGQRLIDTTSRMLIKRFFEKLGAEIAAGEAARAAPYPGDLY
ncbi:MAG: carbon monoxide dehydrogenase subunit G [Acidobacteriia bacterium]|nr:carbon monoxide dehydrogenase subunit G [Terriglobia bacterium]